MRNVFLIIFIFFSNAHFAIAQQHPPVKKSGFAKGLEFQLSVPMITSESVFFDEKNIVKIGLALNDARIFYTLDGSDPTEQSLIFSKEIILTKSTLLKAKAFHPQCLASETVEARFIKLGKLLPVKNITLNRIPHENYPGKGAQGLMDRKKGTTNFRTSEWMGFSGGNVETIIEFKKKTPVQKVTVSVLRDHGAWIFLPEAMEIYGSKNGKDFKLLAAKKISRPKEDSASELHFLEIDFQKENLKFVKVLLKSIPSIPEWHPGKGTAAWLFIDEILVE